MYIGERIATRRKYFIEGLADQFGGLERVNSPDEVENILQPVFTGMSRASRNDLWNELRVLMTQWNTGHIGKEENNPYAGLFYYLDYIDEHTR